MRWPTQIAELDERLERFKDNCTKLLITIDSISGFSSDILPFNSLKDLAQGIIDETDQLDSFIRERVEQGQKTVDTDKNHEEKRPERLDRVRSEVHKLRYELRKLSEFTDSPLAGLANSPALLLVGEGGIGKTHLFCAIASERIQKHLPTVLLLGEKFKNEDPSGQILKLLGVNQQGNLKELLSALNTAAEARNTRCLILIDALNEGDGVKIWQDHLAGILSTIAKYSHLAVAISTRTEYEDYVIPSRGIENRLLVRYEHNGFSGAETRAIQKYFQHFHIEYTVPPLKPEFRNPLFLYSLCRGLSNAGESRIPVGLRGFTRILDYFLSSVNDKLWRKLDYSARANLVHKAIQSLIKEMVVSGRIYLPEDQAKSIVDQYLPNRDYSASLFRHLIAEGVLATTVQDGMSVVRFMYDRFADHLIVAYLLETQLDKDNPSASFREDSYLRKLLTNKGAFAYRYSLITAFAIQVPERIGLELFEIIADINESDLARAVINSLIWRQWDVQEISQPLLNFINEKIAGHVYHHETFLEVILGAAGNPENPFNADFLHRNLINRELAERDSWWSTFLHSHYDLSRESDGAINRIVSWAWSEQNIGTVDDEAVRLIGVILAWFLTASNRFLRDHTTKALIRLFSPKLAILRKIIQSFLEVNDPYVLERLFAVAYGCAMRTTDKQAIRDLAQDVYDWIFKAGTPLPHILLREYARGAIEVAYLKCSDLSIPMKMVRPPYKSDWIDTPPTQEELKAKYGMVSEEMSAADWGMHSIYSSVSDWGDFARYILGTDHEDFQWVSQRLDEPQIISPRQKQKLFFESLTPNQFESWEQFSKALYRPGVIEYRIEETPAEHQDRRLESDINHDDRFSIEAPLSEVDSEPNRISVIEETFTALLESLDDQKQGEFVEYILPNLLDDGKGMNEYYEKTRFDKTLRQRWILQRVFELGWTKEKFGTFDRYLDHWRRDRGAKKAERIGKKYQWIAYHEFLARVSDNFQFRGDRYSGEAPENYDGTWQLHVRDIDPSVLITNTKRDTEHSSWWFTTSYENWNNYVTVQDWMEDSSELPNPITLIEVNDPRDKINWLTLDAMYDWGEPLSPIEDKYDKPHRRIWYMIKSYLVRKQDVDVFVAWAAKQDFMGRWMPESYDLYKVFLGEFFCSAAYKYHRNAQVGYHEWEKSDKNGMPSFISVTVDEYSHEDGYDCSIDESIHIYTPSKYLAEHMDLRWNGVEGSYFDSQGGLIALDPSVKESGPGALLFHKQKLLAFLKTNDLEIVWTLLGEKQLLGGGLHWDQTPGALIINGVYRLDNKNITGNLRADFKSSSGNL